MLISQIIAGVKQSQFQFLGFRAIVDPAAFEAGSFAPLDDESCYC